MSYAEAKARYAAIGRGHRSCHCPVKNRAYLPALLAGR